MSDFSSSSTGPEEPSEDEKEQFIATSTALAASVMVACMLAAHVVKRLKWYWLPESVITMGIGTLAGTLIAASRPRAAHELLFDPRIFFFIMLPPIIFSAGYNMKRRNFFKYFGAILTYAVMGTLIAIVVVAFGLYYACLWWPSLDDLSLVDCFLFASLIANVDPVATLSILGAIDADRQLYSIVFGESMLNDAVSVVLYHTLTKMAETALEVSAPSIFKLVGLFLASAAGSVAFGVAFGLLASFLFHRSQLDNHPPIEGILVFLFSYLAYSVPEILGLSGIMSLFFCGIMLAHYNWYNLSEEARATTRHGIELVSYLTETAVYVYLGLNFAFSFADVTDSLKWNWRFLLLVVLLCFISRAAGVFITSVPFNYFVAEHRRVPLRMQVVIWFSGLRGSVAFALALNVPGPHTPMFVTTTLATVLFTTIFCGGLTEKLVSRMKLKQPVVPEMEEPILGGDMMQHLAGDGELMRFEDTSTSLFVRWRRFDQEVMSRVFGGKRHDRVYLTTAAAERMMANGGGTIDSGPITSEGMHVASMPGMALSPIEETANSPLSPTRGSLHEESL